MDRPTAPNGNKPGALDILCSMLAAFFGVQTAANLDRDDAYIDEVGFRPYIIAGVLLTLVLIGLLWTTVQLIIS
jgi:hypothetical protein